MTNTISLKADIKMIVRDPILVLFFILPIITTIILRLAVKFLTPIIYNYNGFDLTQYCGYILALGILMTPLMLGTVAGFLMIDERDSKIQELIKVSPIGYVGYISNRLMLPFIGSIVYTILAYFILSIYHVIFPVLLLICILAGIQGILVGYFLYILAADKVQGLTYSKEFGAFNILVLADVLNIKWFSIIAGLTPFYWITRIIVNCSLYTVLAAIIIHILYLLIILRLR